MIQAGFMVNIILSGNFAFLNYLTIIPALAAFDDDCFPKRLREFVYHKRGVNNNNDENKTGFGRALIDIALLIVIGMLSVPVISNLLQLGGKHQAMNASFSSFKLVNTYGAFGSVGTSRYEPIISVSNDGQTWIEIDCLVNLGGLIEDHVFVPLITTVSIGTYGLSDSSRTMLCYSSEKDGCSLYYSTCLQMT